MWLKNNEVIESWVLRDGMTPQIYHLITFDMLMVLKRYDNKLDFCQYCQWFSEAMSRQNEIFLV